MRLSVIVPVFNQAPFLEEAVASIRAERPDEIVVVDNGSTDNPTLSDMGGIVWVRMEQNAGPSKARNEGAKVASGAILLFLDGDDRLLPGCIDNRREWFASNPELGLVQGNVRMVDGKGDLIRASEPAYAQGFTSHWDAAEAQSCLTAALAVRKSAYEAIGGFDESLWVAEDSDILIRMAAKFPCAYETRLTADYRILQGSLSRRYDRLVESYPRQMKKNEPLFAEDLPRYRELCRNTYYRLVRDRVFSKLLRERGAGALLGEVARLKLGGLFGRYVLEKLRLAKRA
jgi:glycosyltransferase involved in cell wall biosynthesis